MATTIQTGKSEGETVELRQGIYLLPGEKPGSHVYLVRGSNKNVLIDTGITSNLSFLRGCFDRLGLRIEDIHLVLLTHEHFDHIGASMFFFDAALIGAHRLAANKIELQDEFVTMNKYFNVETRPFHAHLWMEDNSMFELGNYQLRVLHTPGHTSGCICIYEQKEGILFSGDTVFAKGTLSDIAASGNISDYVNSLERLSHLKIVQLCPGHGQVSFTPEQDIKQAVTYARILMEDSKLLFEALTKRAGIPTQQRVLKGLEKASAKGEKQG